MKTLYGITYAQLINLTTEELNEYMAVHTANQVRESILAAYPNEDKVKLDKFTAVYMKHALVLYNEIFTDKLYKNQRSLYDTEERFDMACDMVTDMGNITVLTAGLMDKVLQEVFSDGF